jgi:hypothetical protein
MSKNWGFLKLLAAALISMPATAPAHSSTISTFIVDKF